MPRVPHRKRHVQRNKHGWECACVWKKSNLVYRLARKQTSCSQQTSPSRYGCCREYCRERSRRQGLASWFVGSRLFVQGTYCDWDVNKQQYVPVPVDGGGTPQPPSQVLFLRLHPPNFNLPPVSNQPGIASRCVGFVVLLFRRSVRGWQRSVSTCCEHARRHVGMICYRASTV